MSVCCAITYWISFSYLMKLPHVGSSHLYYILSSWMTFDVVLVCVQRLCRYWFNGRKFVSHSRYKPLPNVDVGIMKRSGYQMGLVAIPSLGISVACQTAHLPMWLWSLPWTPGLEIYHTITGTDLLGDHGLPGWARLCGTPDSLLSTHGLLLMIGQTGGRYDPQPVARSSELVNLGLLKPFDWRRSDRDRKYYVLKCHGPFTDCSGSSFRSVFSEYFYMSRRYISCGLYFTSFLLLST